MKNNIKTIGDAIAGNRLNDEQKVAIAYAINENGTGQHPYAESDTIDGFALDYALQCAAKEILELRKMLIKAREGNDTRISKLTWPN